MVKRIFVVDTETTGLDRSEDRMVEICAIEITLDEQGLADYQNIYLDTLVNPERSIPIEAKAIHHITEDMVASAPTSDSPIVQVAIDAMLATGAMAAHNAAFDRGFVAPQWPNWICTLRLAHHLYPDAPSFGLHELRYYLGLEFPHGLPGYPHRAAYDATVAAALLARELAECAKHGPDSIERALELSNTNALLKRMPFGKHKGELFSRIPPDYLSRASRTIKSDDADVMWSIHQAAFGRFRN